MKRKLFVYGTLKRGEKRHFCLENSKYIGKAFVTGFELFYYIFGYPILVRNPESKKKIWGEVFLVPDEVLDRIRSLELKAGYKEGEQNGMIFFYKENYGEDRHLLLPISEYTGKKEEVWKRKLYAGSRLGRR